MNEKDIIAAIKSCEDRIRNINSVPNYYHGKRQRKRALQLEEIKIMCLKNYIEHISESEKD